MQAHRCAGKLTKEPRHDQQEDPATPDRSALPEIDPADMDNVSGGCQNCGPANNGASSASKLTALLPMLANQAGR